MGRVYGEGMDLPGGRGKGLGIGRVWIRQERRGKGLGTERGLGGCGSPRREGVEEAGDREGVDLPGEKGEGAGDRKGTGRVWIPGAGEGAGDGGGWGRCGSPRREGKGAGDGGGDGEGMDPPGEKGKGLGMGRGWGGMDPPGEKGGKKLGTGRVWIPEEGGRRG